MTTEEKITDLLTKNNSKISKASWLEDDKRIVADNLYRLKLKGNKKLLKSIYKDIDEELDERKESRLPFITVNSNDKELRLFNVKFFKEDPEKNLPAMVSLELSSATNGVEVDEW